MNAILRAPQNVPSLFSQGGDHDDASPSSSPLAKRLAECLAGYRGCQVGEARAALARYSPPLAASPLLLLLIGKPVVRIASLALGAGHLP